MRHMHPTFMFSCFALAAVIGGAAGYLKAQEKSTPSKPPKPFQIPALPIDPPTPPQVPKDASEATEQAKGLWALAKAKQWLAVSAGGIWLAMFLIKVGRKRVSFMKKLPKRALWIIVPLLSVTALVLTKLQTNLSWNDAVLVLLSGPSVAFLNDFWKRGILGKEPSPLKQAGG